MEQASSTHPANAAIDLVEAIEAHRAIGVARAIADVALPSALLAVWLASDVLGAQYPAAFSVSVQYFWYAAIIAVWLVIRAAAGSASVFGAAVASSVGLLFGGMWFAWNVANVRGDLDAYQANGSWEGYGSALVLDFAPLLLLSAALGFFGVAWRTWPLRDISREIVSIEPGANAVTALLEPFLLWRGYRRPAISGLAASSFMMTSSIVQGLACLLVLPAAAFGVTAVLLILSWVVQSAFAVISGGYVDVMPVIGGLMIIGVLAWLIFAPLGLLVGAIATRLKQVARFLVRQSYASLAERDTRPPILFLRTFADDQCNIRIDGPLNRALRGMPTVMTLDHILVEQFSAYGPIVAIGKPGEAQLPFGAARKYVGHDVWQQEVLAIAERACAIVMVLDNTPGLHWETHNMLERFREKTLFLCAPGRDASSVLAAWLAEHHGAATSPGAGAIAGFEIGPNTWLAIESPTPSIDAYVLALKAFFRRTSIAQA